MSDEIIHQFTKRIGIPFADANVKPSPLNQLRPNPVQFAIAQRIAERARPFLPPEHAGMSDTEIKANVLVAEAYNPGVDIHKLMISDDAQFRADFCAILASLDRSTGMLPAWVKLHCLKK